MLKKLSASQGMVDEFNKHAKEEKIPPKSVHAIRAELKGEESELDGKKFNVIMVSRPIWFPAVEIPS